MSKNNVLLITAPPRDQMTPDFFSCTWDRAPKHAIKFYFDTSKHSRDMSSHRNRRRRRQIWLAVAGKQSQSWKRH